MCGICGIYNFKSRRPVDERELVCMRDSLVHRGPDEAGLYRHNELGLAIRRLSIIDLNTGSQPIWNEDKTVVVVYNGEIYNFRDLRQELEKRGHCFTTSSDTEVIVHAYEEYGDECIANFEGMFAFGLWDSRRQRLLLARDRLGIKPLFYAITDEGLLFGSEIKAILAAGFPRSLDIVALDQYLSHFYVPAPWTMFNGIRKLLPGHALVCSNGHLREFEYWDLEYAPQPKLAGENVEERLRERLEQAVHRHLQSDVPLGAFLSGGLDSSTVVAFMSSLLDEPVRTFTVGFPQTSYDERPEARQVAACFRTNHTEHILQSNLAELVPKLARCFDEPFGDYSAFATYAVSQLAREYVKVVLSGDGGDELFAGYQTHYAYRIARLYRKVPALVRRGLIEPLIGRLPTSMDRITFDYMAKRFVQGAELPFEQGHYSWKAIFSEVEKESLYNPAFKAMRQKDGDGYAVFERYFRKVAHLDPLSQLLYVDAKTFLVDDNLTKVDRTSMANSLEVRVPLLDTQLIDFMCTLQPQIKQPSWGTKHLLRRTMRSVLPKQLIRGKKKGFTPPMPYWLQGELKDLTLDVLSKHSLSQIGLFSEGYVTRLINDHVHQRQDNNRQLWTLMSLMVWWETYKLS